MSNNKHFGVKSPVCSPVQKPTDKCTINIKSETKCKPLYEENPHFTCVIKNRFEPLSPSQTFCTENDTDLRERLQVSLKNKQGPDSTPNKVVSTIGQATAVNRESRSTLTVFKVKYKILKKSPQASIMDDKYELALQVKNKNKENLNNAKSDPTHQKWNSQNKDKFGFIPLGPLILPYAKNKLKKVLIRLNCMI